MQYSHRLPADYDLRTLRERAARRGPLWDGAPGLGFKAFVLQTRGQHGAAAHLYASVYLWLDVAEATRFLMDARFQNVIDGFGRPGVETWLPLDARAGAGKGAPAAWLHRETIALPEQADRAAAHAQAQADSRERATQPHVLATWIALDPLAWRSVRFTLLAELDDAAHTPDAHTATYEVLHLAQPGAEALA